VFFFFPLCFGDHFVLEGAVVGVVVVLFGAFFPSFFKGKLFGFCCSLGFFWFLLRILFFLKNIRAHLVLTLSTWFQTVIEFFLVWLHMLIRQGARLFSCSFQWLFPVQRKGLCKNWEA